MHFRRPIVGLLALFLIAMAPVSLAQVTVEVEGNVVTADIQIGGVEADLTITFDEVVGLSAESIGIDAELVDVGDALLLARLPDLGMGIPAAFPLMITIEPPASRGLSFTGTAHVEIHTHALSLTTNSPFRLLKAPLGGDFSDITESLAAGSVRSRGRTGGFSQFLIGVEVRNHDTVAEDKLADLRVLVADPVIPSALRSELTADLDAAEAAFIAGNYVSAVGHLESLIDRVDANQGSAIPNVWRAGGDLNNLAGRLIAGSRTLMFTLRMANSLL